MKTLIALAVGVFLFLALWPGTERGLQELSGRTMGTGWSVTLHSRATANELDALRTEIDALLLRLDREIFSTYTAESELSSLNSLPLEQPVDVSPEMAEVLQAALAVHEASGGVFDITIGPLVNLWGFGPQARTGLPAPEEIERARARMGIEHLELDVRNRTFARAAAVELDLSGIAKGYAVDRVAELLQSHGYSDYLVEIGGELRLSGKRSEDEGWMIAIEQPAAGERSAFTALALNGESLALAGSGDYRNFRVEEGKRYSHEIDPRTGYPVDHQLAAVTVLAENAMYADAWATALMVLGPEEGMAVADMLDLAAYFIMYEEQGFDSIYTEQFVPYLDD